jgi:hypothetical protein
VADWVSCIEEYKFEDSMEMVTQLVSPAEVHRLTEVNLKGNEEKGVRDTRCVAPITDRNILMAGPSPNTEIFEHPWYELCVPQIIARADVDRTSRGETPSRAEVQHWTKAGRLYSHGRSLKVLRDSVDWDFVGG